MQQTNPSAEQPNEQPKTRGLEVADGSSSSARPGRKPLPYHIIRALRPTQWVKNLVVFAAAVFASRFDVFTFFYATLALGAFCLVASAVYLVNDILDVKADREHPKKRKRPIAAGDITVPFAIVLAGACLSLGLLLAMGTNTMFTAIILLYLLLQVAYNLYLKYQSILDVMAIAAGFVLRALGGAFAVQVMPSSWFILCVGLLALYLGIEKRKAELVALGQGGSTRKVLQFYTVSWLNRMEGIVTAGALMTYSMWAVMEASSRWMMLTIVFVIYGLFKYQYLSENGEGEAPENTLLGSPALIINCLLWALTCCAVLALHLP